MKSIYPKYDKNSDLSRGCTNTAARVRSGSHGDGGHGKTVVGVYGDDPQDNYPIRPSESMRLTRTRRKG